MQYVARGMAERGDGGAIVNVSSVAACTVLKDHLAYCETLQLTLLTAVLHSFSPVVGTSKAGLDMVTKMMAFELGHEHKVSYYIPDIYTDHACLLCPSRFV